MANCNQTLGMIRTETWRKPQELYDQLWPYLEWSKIFLTLSSSKKEKKLFDISLALKKIMNIPPNIVLTVL